MAAHWRRVPPPRWPLLTRGLGVLLASLIGLTLIDLVLTGLVGTQSAYYAQLFYPAMMAATSSLLYHHCPWPQSISLTLLGWWAAIALWQGGQVLQSVIGPDPNLWRFIANATADYAFTLAFLSLTASLCAIMHCLHHSGLLHLARGNARAKRQSAHAFGNARFANAKEMRALTQGPGVIIGQLPSDKHPNPNAPLLRIPLEGHALTLAPPRSGKLVSSISPNLACEGAAGWPGPVIVIDPKGESAAIWARHRAKRGHHVYICDPFAVLKDLGAQTGLSHLTELETHCFNPLLGLNDHPQRLRRINAITEALITPPVGGSEGSLHFYLSAKRVISGLIAWICHRSANTPQCQLYAVLNQLNQAKPALNNLLINMQESHVMDGLPADAANLLLNVEERERGSIFSTVTNALAFLQYPQMRQSLATSTLDISDVLHGNTDIFIVAPGDMLAELKPWLRLWINLPIELLFHQRPKQRLLMLVDEMAALGRLESLKRMMNLGAGYGLSIWGFTQHLNDLKALYGEHDAMAMLGMVDILQCYNIAPTDLIAQQWLSRLLGTQTILLQGSSHSHGKSDTGINSWQRQHSDNQAQSISPHQRPLVNSEELAKLADFEQLVFIKQHPPLKLHKTRYWQRQSWQGQFDDNPYHNQEL